MSWRSSVAVEPPPRVPYWPATAVPPGPRRMRLLPTSRGKENGQSIAVTAVARLREPGPIVGSQIEWIESGNGMSLVAVCGPSVPHAAFPAA